MENLLQVPSDIVVAEPGDRRDSDSLGRHLSLEANVPGDRVRVTVPTSRSRDLVRGGILPDLSLEPRESCEPGSSHGKYDGISAERKALLELADKHIKDRDLLSRFKADMALFETRGLKDGLSPGEIGKTYTNIARLLEAGPDARVSDTNRAVLAHQVMRQAASPSSIDQGWHNTCNVTSIESNLYKKEPSRVAGLIADVVTTGSYRGAKGEPVSVPRSSFTPDREASKPVTVDGERSFASQLFQVTAVNLYYKNSGSVMRYEQVDCDHEDNGERLRPWGVVPTGSDSPRLSVHAMADIHELIVGRRDSMLILQHKDFSAKGRDSIAGFGSKEELARTLDEAQRLKKFPVIMLVNTGHPPFSRESEGWHVLNIADYDASTGEVTLDNSWGTAHDVTIKVDDLYALSMTREAMASKEVAADNPNVSEHLKNLKVLDLLMQRGKAVKPEALTKSLEEAAKAWKVAPGEGIEGTAERREYLKTLEKIFSRFDFSTRFAFLNQMSDSPRGSSYIDMALERLFANTAHDVGFTHKSLKSIAPQGQEFGRKIAAIWSTLPAARQQRILAAMADKGI